MRNCSEDSSAGKGGRMKIRSPVPLPLWNNLPMRWTVFALLGLLAASSLAQEAGWKRFEHGDDGYSWRYLPPDLVGGQDLPLVVFLHGYGSSPEIYGSLISFPAREAGVVLIAPAAIHSPGWIRGVDEPTVEAALAAVTEELSIDPSRIGWAGHSAGGAYAIELSYLEARPVAGVFAMAAPFRSIGALGNPDWTPPLRMFYGTLDQNYLSALPLYEPQWQALGVPYELDIREGLGHNSLDTDAIEDGFRFLAAQRSPAASCRTTATAPCLLGGRFRVEVDWATADGGTGAAATVADGTSADSALMWFFQPENWEILVKVLDGCAVNGHVWVFAAAATNVEWTLRVTDTATNRVETWTNPLGVRSPALTATAAFACSN